MVVNPYRNSGIRTPYTQGSVAAGGKAASCSCVPTRWLIVLLVISITVISYVFHIHHGLTLEPKHEEPPSKLRGGTRSSYRKPTRVGLTSERPSKLSIAPDQDKNQVPNVNENKVLAPPTLKPSPSPTSEKPTHGPTPPPRVWPTILPTPLPTILPTLVPSIAPSALPTIAPSQLPTLAPTAAAVSKITAMNTATDAVVVTNLNGKDKVEASQPVESNTIGSAVQHQEGTSPAVLNHNQPSKISQIEETTHTNKEVAFIPIKAAGSDIPPIPPMTLPEADSQQPVQVLTPPKEVTFTNQQLPAPTKAVIPPPAANEPEQEQHKAPDGEQMISVEEAGEVKQQPDLIVGNERIDHHISRFDLPPSVKVVYPGQAKVISSNRNSTSADGSKTKVDYCKGHIDPFEEQSIENFTPPPSATFDKVVEWKSTVKETLKGIGKLQIGGEKLRKIMEQEVDKLKILRFRLFCEYAL